MFKTEVWTEIYEYENDYKISNYGHIYSKKK